MSFQGAVTGSSKTKHSILHDITSEILNNQAHHPATHENYIDDDFEDSGPYTFNRRERTAGFSPHKGNADQSDSSFVVINQS